MKYIVLLRSDNRSIHSDNQIVIDDITYRNVYDAVTKTMSIEPVIFHIMSSWDLFKDNLNDVFNESFLNDGINIINNQMNSNLYSIKIGMEVTNMLSKDECYTINDNRYIQYL
jgi:hypothetical protein